MKSIYSVGFANFAYSPPINSIMPMNVLFAVSTNLLFVSIIPALVSY